MISATTIQSAYVELYRQLRKYIWAFATVERIAELEISVYKSFPDMAEIERNYDALSLDIRGKAREDEELQSAMDAFAELAHSTDTIYASLNQVHEVIST